MLFTIIPYDYMLENGYEEENIENASVDNIIKSEIEDRKYNHYTSVSYDAKYISNYYFYKYRKYVMFNIQGAYDKIAQEYKEEKFPTIDEYKKYLSANLKNILSGQLTSYNTNNGENYKDYICEDQNGNKYTFRETGINQYTIMIN